MELAFQLQISWYYICYGWSGTAYYLWEWKESRQLYPIVTQSQYLYYWEASPIKLIKWKQFHWVSFIPALSNLVVLDFKKHIQSIGSIIRDNGSWNLMHLESSYWKRPVYIAVYYYWTVGLYPMLTFKRNAVLFPFYTWLRKANSFTKQYKTSTNTENSAFWFAYPSGWLCRKSNYHFSHYWDNYRKHIHAHS